MSNEKFTQGEWAVSTHRDEVSVYMGEAVNNPYEHNCSDVWCCDSQWWENDETAIANAHLISAAPDMYRALRDVLDECEMQQDGYHLASLTQYEVEAVRAALSKADGEQQ